MSARTSRRHRAGMQKQEQSRQVVAAYHEEVHSGPLPSPDVYERYEAVNPGAAERILAMAENQAAHRQKLEMIKTEAEVMRLNAEIRDSLLGVIFAFVLGLACIAVAAVAIVLSPSDAGTVFGGVIGVAGIGAIITAFLTNTRIGRK